MPSAADDASGAARAAPEPARLGTAAAERVVTHVAVDRWTGGAAENLLFSVAEPVSASWQPIQMSLAAGPPDLELTGPSPAGRR